jgi:hypothetical protein
VDEADTWSGRLQPHNRQHDLVNDVIQVPPDPYSEWEGGRVGREWETWDTLCYIIKRNTLWTRRKRGPDAWICRQPLYVIFKFLLNATWKGKGGLEERRRPWTLFIISYRGELCIYYMDTLYYLKDTLYSIKRERETWDTPHYTTWKGRGGEAETWGIVQWRHQSRWVQ